MKAKSFSTPRSITDIDAIRINWDEAINDVKRFIDKVKNGPFHETLRSYDLLRRVQDFYKKDDVCTYLNILDDNRDILKNNTIIKSGGDK